MADKMWDILNFLKNPSGDGVKENDTVARERIRQINEQLEGAIENPSPDIEPVAVRKESETNPAGGGDGFPSGDTLPGVAAPISGKPIEEKPQEKKKTPHGAISEGKFLDIPVVSVNPNPYQPRKELGEQEIAELSESIKEFGVLQPILVRQTDEGYELIAGERRLRASRLAGLETVPAIVVEAEPLHQQIMALVENIQRKNLSSVEEAESLQDILLKTGWSQNELSSRMGCSQASIANKLRLLRLDPAVQELVLSRKLGERQARALLSLSPEDQKTLAEKAVYEEMSARAVETAAENWNNKTRAAKHKASRNSAEDPGGELLGDIATLVNKHKNRGMMAQWKVKQMNQSSLVVEITVDLMKNVPENVVEAE